MISAGVGGASWPEAGLQVGAGGVCVFCVKLGRLQWWENLPVENA